MGTTEELFGKEEAEAPAGQEQTATKAEQTETATAEQETQGEEQAGEVNPYTPEELAELLANEEAIDTTRLSLEGQALMKSFQRGLTPKLENIAKLKKELESTIEQAKATPREKTVYDYFDEDSEGTLQRINYYVSQKKVEARNARSMGNDTEAEAAMDEADRWTDIRTELIGRESIRLKKELREQKELDKKKGALPEYDKKHDIAQEYLSSKLSMSQNRIDQLLSDVEMVKHFATLSEHENARITAKSKIVKTTPGKLGKPGSTGQEKATADFDYSAEFAKAKKTGDWSRVLAYKDGLLGG